MVAGQGNLLVNDVRLLNSVHPRHLFAAIAFLGLGPGPRVGAGHPVDAVSIGGLLDDSGYLRPVFVFGAPEGDHVHSINCLAHTAGV